MAHCISRKRRLEVGSLVSSGDLTFNRGGTEEDCSARRLLARMREAIGISRSKNGHPNRGRGLALSSKAWGLTI